MHTAHKTIIAATIWLSLQSAGYCATSTMSDNTRPGAQSSIQNSSNPTIPVAAGIWQGQGCFNTQTYPVSLEIKQDDSLITATLKSPMAGSTAIHYIKGNYSADQKQFDCADIGTDRDTHSAPMPLPISHYEFHLVEEGTKLVGSAQIDPYSKMWFTFTKSNGVFRPIISNSPASPGQVPAPLSNNSVNPGQVSANVPTINAPANNSPSSSFLQSSGLQGSMPLADAQRTNQAAALVNQSKALREANKLQECRALLEQACLLDPNLNSPCVHNDLGITLQQLGELKLALKEFQTTLSFKPDMPPALYGVANCYFQLGDMDQAADSLKDYLSKYPDMPNSDGAKRMLISLQATPRLRDDPSANDYYVSAITDKKAIWAPDRQPITIYVEPGDKVEGYQPSFQQALFTAFDKWVAASNNRISWTLISKKKKPDIVCRWVSNRDKFRNPAGAELGETILNYIANPRYPNQAYIKDVNMLLCTINLDAKTVMNDEQMAYLCLHEVGHALGIKSHSSNNNDVMFFMMKSHLVTELSPRDKATILHLYSNTYSY